MFGSLTACERVEKRYIDDKLKTYIAHANIIAIGLVDTAQSMAMPKGKLSKKPKPCVMAFTRSCDAFSSVQVIAIKFPIKN